ncbi:hypothetical protein FB451DRAFT_1375350 [Mycena latifolia]|nr:hypothetical protein FB451DRAFT_1375350 [Mycena latifolia]
MATPSNGWSSLSPSPHDPPAPFLVKASLRASPGVMPQHSQGLKTQYSLASLPTDPTSSLEAPNVASPSLKRRKSPGRKASSVKSQVSSPNLSRRLGNSHAPSGSRAPYLFGIPNDHVMPHGSVQCGVPAALEMKMYFYLEASFVKFPPDPAYGSNSPVPWVHPHLFHSTALTEERVELMLERHEREERLAHNMGGAQEGASENTWAQQWDLSGCASLEAERLVLGLFKFHFNRDDGRIVESAIAAVQREIISRFDLHSACRRKH